MARRGCGAGVSGIWRISRITGGTLGVVEDSCWLVVDEDEAAAPLRKFARSSLTDRFGLSVVFRQQSRRQRKGSSSKKKKKKKKRKGANLPDADAALGLREVADDCFK